MYDEKSIEMGRNLFLLDSVLTAMALAAALVLRNVVIVDEGVGFPSYMAMLPLILALNIALLSYFGAYQGPCHAGGLAYAWAVLKTVVLGVGVLIAVFYVLEIKYVSRLVMGAFAVLEFAVLLGPRLYLKRYHTVCVRRGKTSSRVLILGTGERARELSENLREKAEWGIEVIGHLDPDETRVGTRVLGAPVIGTVEDIQQILKDNVVDEVIIAIPRSMLADAEHIAQACEEEGIKLRFMADLFNLEVARTKLVKLGRIPVLSLEPVAQDEIQLLIKRGFDLVVTIVFLPFVLLLMAVIAAAVKLDSPGPAFFVQQRVGLKKRLFPMLKFRSMYVDAEDKLKDIEHLNEAEGPIFKIKDDPRITRVGRFIRRTSLDELPQLFNVLRGEMSLVGPRPMSIRDVDLFDRGIQRKRFSVKPGLTCLWQISGRSDLPFTKWLELDLKYIENWTLFLDLKILFKTIPVVLFAKGAV